MTIPNFEEVKTEVKKINKNDSDKNKKMLIHKPTPAFIMASWIGLGIGVVSYCVGLWNAEMLLSEKGYYFSILILGLFSAVSVQKSVRDRAEGIKVTDTYYGVSWIAILISLILIIIGLWNANLLLSEKGFYGITFIFSIFTAIAVQKNIRDAEAVDRLMKG